MMDILKLLLPRLIQDLVTTSAGILAAHGFLGTDQIQGYEGSVIFLAMLGLNYVIHTNRQVKAVQMGADAAGEFITHATALNLIKGKTP